MSYNLENENENELETFFNLLNPNTISTISTISTTSEEYNNLEHYNNTQAINKISEINDNIINNGVQFLEASEKQIVSKNNTINEVNNNTSLLYNYIYTIFITILVIIILGIITYLKQVLNLNENMYMVLIVLTILSYIFYVMYLFNIMYTQESINKIFNFIRTGQFELGPINLGKVPQSVYIQQLCKKRKALETTTQQDSTDSSLINNNVFKAPRPNVDDKNALFYNDHNSPKQQLFPVIPTKDIKYMIHNVDADISKRQLIPTSRL
jgi:hypothetical protein